MRRLPPRSTLGRSAAASDVYKRQVPGLADVDTLGGLAKQYDVLVDPNRLTSFGLTLRQVHAAVAGNNQNAGGSYIEPVSYTHLRAHETVLAIVCRPLLQKKKQKKNKKQQNNTHQHNYTVT